MRIATVFSGIALALIGFAVASADEPNAGWTAGLARADITPEGPVWMAGYAARKSPSEGVIQPLHAKALALRDAGGRTIVWITADVIGFDRPFTEAVINQIRDKHKLEREAVALFASHTHTGPTLRVSEESFRALGIDPESPAAKNNFAFRKGLEGKLVQLASDALGAMKPASVSHAVGKAGFAMNRREKTATGFKIGVNPNGPTDKSVPVLRVTDAVGKPVAVVFGYACHNTTLTDKTMSLSGDYAGFAQVQIEERHPGAVALFLTGCAGDANPEPRGQLEQARDHGRVLADAVEDALASPMQSLEAKLRSAFAEPMIHFAGPTDRASYEQRLQEPGSGRQAHAKRILAALDAGKPIKVDYVYPVQAFELGDRLTVLALAGEVVADYALRLKKELHDDSSPLWVAAYANDVFGYVGSARVIREGGYEGLEAYYYSTFPTPLDEGVEEVVIRAAEDVAAKVRPK
jgi:hypothetical protein